jgi:hypothetical protein
MSNHLKFCGCKTCRAGRHRPGAKTTIKRASRRLRHDAKVALKKGKEPPAKTSVGYTD